MQNKQSLKSQLSLDLLLSPQVPTRGSHTPQTTAVKSCLVPSPVFDTYWRFAAERQKVFFARASGEPGPWTTDPILSRYRFTNTYRASDRVSQYLISKIQHQGPQDSDSLFFRTILFKIFNKIETWELLEGSLGTIYPHEGMEREYNKVFERAMSQGTRIYSAAYIMPSGTGAFAFARKHQSHLALITHMMKERVPDRLRECKTMQQAFSLLRSYPTFGDFLAYQYVTDLNYSNLIVAPHELLASDLSSANSISIANTEMSIEGKLVIDVHVEDRRSKDRSEDTQHDWYIDTLTRLPVRLTYNMPLLRLINSQRPFIRLFEPVTIDYSDYSTEANIAFPRTIVKSQQRSEQSTITITTVRSDLSVSVSDIELPREASHQ
jgi:hypothetical protein